MRMIILHCPVLPATVSNLMLLPDMMKLKENSFRSFIRVATCGTSILRSIPNLIVLSG